MLENIVEIDTAMTNLRKVMSDSTDFSKVFDDANDSAERFATTIKGALDAYQVAAKAGFGQEDLKFITDAALVTANVGEMSQEQAAESLISTLIQYKKEAKDAMSVIDAWNNISNKNATTVTNLSQGFSKAAATANSFQLSMHELNALIGTVTASTKQSGNEIGNFLKTAMPRLLMGGTQSSLRSIGVEFMKNAEEMKSAFAIYEEVAKKFESGQLSNIQQNEIAEALGGKRHISRMTALLNNWKLVEKQMVDSTESQGSALIENEKYMESLQARINALKRSFELLSVEIGNAFLTDTFIGVVEALTSMAKGAAWVSENIGVLPILFGTTGTASALLSKRFRTTTIAVLTLGSGLQRLGVSAKSAKLALRGLAASTGVGLVFVGLGFAIEKLISGISKASKDLDESTKKLKTNANQFEDNANRIDKLVDKYEELKPKAEKSAEAQDELRKVMEELHDIAPQLTGRIDEQGDSFNLNAEKARVYADTLRDMSKEQQTLLKEQLKLQIIDKEKELEKETKKLQENKEEWHETLSAIQDVEKEYGSLDQAIRELESRKSPDMSMIDKADIDAQIAHIRVLKEEIFKTPYGEQEVLVKQLEKSLESLNQDLDSVSDSLNGASTAQDNLSDSIKEANQPIRNQLTALEDLQKTISDSTKQTDLLKKAEKELQEQGYLSQDTLDQLMLTYQNFGDILGGTEEDLYSFITAKTDEKIAFINTEKDKTKALIEQTQLRINALKTEYELYDRAQAIQQKRLESQVKQGLITPEQADLHMRNFYLKSGVGILSGISQAQKELEEAQGRLNYLDYTEKNMGRSDTGSKSSSTSTKSYTPYETDTFAQSIDNFDTKIDQLQGRLSQLDKTTEQYRQGQRDLISLFEQKQALTSKQADDLRHENELIKQRLDTEKLTREERDKLQQQYDDNKNTINSLSRVWWDYKGAIISANNAIKDSFNEVEDAAKRLKEEFSNEIFRYMDYEIEQLERSKREAQQTAQVKIDALQNEIDRLEDRNNLLQEEEERQRRLLDLSKQRQKLENIQREKNVRLFQNGEFVWVADPRKVREETERLQELESDYRQWEVENTRRHEIQRLQDQIKSIQNELKKEEDKYDQQIKNLRDFMTEYKREQFNFSQEQLATINTLIEGIKGMENASYAERLSMIQKFVTDYNSILNGMKSTSGTLSSPSSSTPSNPLGMSDADYKTYLQNKKNWDDGINRTRANMANEALRRKYGIGSDQYSYSDLAKTTPPKTNDIVKTSVSTRIGVVKRKPIIAKPKIPTLSSRTTGGTGDTNYNISVDKVQTNDASNFIAQIKGMVRS
jgi:TP901 family phage tail tape measure protein